MIYLIVFLVSIVLLTLLAFKWELEMKIAVPWSLLLGVLAGLTLFLLNRSNSLSVGMQLAIGILQTLCLSGVAILVLFFRDPERTPPKKDGVVLSPADGRIKYVKRIQGGTFPFALKGRRSIPLTEFTEKEIVEYGGIQIGIGLSLLDVHVNRCPVTGQISFIKKIPGRFKSLKKVGSLLENERAIAIIEGEAIKIGLVLIASRLVRRIVLYVKEQEYAGAGQRIGMIRFGSQVDVLIPDQSTLTIHAKPGDTVRAGETILATYSDL